VPRGAGGAGGGGTARQDALARRAGTRRRAELASYRDAVDAGTAAFRDGRYAEARAAFERAFAIHADPVILFNIASCWRREGRAVQAVAAYLRFLDLAPVGDPRRALATETVATLEAELAATPALEPDAAAAGAPVASTPSGTAAPVPDEDPEPRIEVSPEPAATAAAVPLPAAPAPARPRSALRPVGIGLTAVGLLVLAGGGVEALRARSLEHDVEGFHGHAWNGDEAETYDKGKSTARRAMLLTITGAAVVGSGVTLFYLGRSRERAVRIGAAPTSDGAAAVLAGRF
jgi:hypothetical protein